MTTQTYESNPVWQRAFAWLWIALGIILTYLARDYLAAASLNSIAGFSLGVLLVVIGVAASFAVARQSVTIDPEARCITVVDVGNFGVRRRAIAFDDITRTATGTLGRYMNAICFHYIVLTLKSGEEFPLFAPGRFFDGWSDRAAMEERRMRLEQWINAN